MGGYQFSYDSGSGKVKETVITGFGNTYGQTHYENGEIKKQEVIINPMMPSGTTTYYYDNKLPESKREEQQEKTTYSGIFYNNANSSVIVNYNTEINLSFFDDKGADIYSKARTSMGSSVDSYKSTLNNLIKRCPFGSKAN